MGRVAARAGAAFALSGALAMVPRLEEKTMSQSPQPDPTPAEPVHPGSPLLTAVGGFARLMMIIPVIATFLTALALLVYGGIETWHFIDALYFSGHAPTRDEALLLAIEIVDLFLLGTVVQVVSLGIYQLYFRQDLRLPKWLRIDDLDDLKSKLVGVTITVLAVFFLGQVIVGDGDIGILYLGAAVALVIVALTYFLRQMNH
jgi:uncharacterized membrane protein YqhA